MPNRFQSAQHEVAYGLIADRDGEYCLVPTCHRKPPQVKLQIDHADNNPHNWKAKNLHLLCQRHNLEMRKLTSAEHKQLIEFFSARNVCVRESELGSLASKQVKGFANYHIGSEEMKVNSLCEQVFIDWLLKYIKKNGFILKQEAINSGAYVAGCNVATIHRYLAPLTSMLGPLRETRDETGTAIISFREQPKRKSTKKEVKKQGCNVGP